MAPGFLNGWRLAALNGVEPLCAALAYASIGWQVFPVASVDQRTGHCGCKQGPSCEVPGKHPIVRWTERATRDTRQLSHWWRWQPYANVACRDRAGVGPRCRRHRPRPWGRPHPQGPGGQRPRIAPDDNGQDP